MALESILVLALFSAQLAEVLQTSGRHIPLYIMNIVNPGEHPGKGKMSDNFMRRQEINQLLFDKKKIRQKVFEYNCKAIQYSSAEKWDESLKYLTLAENLLEEAAIKGYIIDKYLVICVLNNLASCYQNLWKLQMCSNYLEALIYNLNEKNHDEQEDRHYALHLSYKTIFKLTLSQYYLQFSAINSELQLHSGALISARKSLNIIKSELKEWQETFLHQKNKNKADYQQMQNKFRIINTFNDNVSLNSQEIIFQAANFYYSMWQSNVLNAKKKNKEVEEFIENFSLKSIMNLNYLSYAQCKQQIEKPTQISYLLLTKHIFMLSACYFTISTELRLISEKKSKINFEKENYAEIPEFKESQIYHLFAILILTLSINHQSYFMKSLIAVFQNNYSRQLTKSTFNRIFNEILFVKEQKFQTLASIELSSIEEGLVSNISKEGKTMADMGKIKGQGYLKSKNSEIIYERHKIKKCKTSSKSKELKEKISNIKMKNGKKSTSKSPSSKIAYQKSSILKKQQLLKKSPPSKETLASNTIPSLKYLAKNITKIKSNLPKNQHTKKDKTHSKHKPTSTYQINEYFLPKKSSEKRLKSGSGSKNSQQQLKVILAGRLPLHSTLETKDKVIKLSSKQKQKKKRVKKSLIEHYL